MNRWRGMLAGAAVVALAGALLTPGSAPAHADAVQDGRANLLANASFEEGADVTDAPGWSVLWGRTEVVSFTADRASDGARSLHVVRDEDGRSGGFISDPVPVEGGERYEFSFDQYLAGGSLSATMHFFDAEGTVISNTYEMVTTTADTWERGTAYFEAPAEAVAARPILYAASGVTVDSYLDNVFFGSVNLLTNVSFEEGADVTSAPGWSVLWGRDELVSFSSERASDGVRSLHIVREDGMRTGGLVSDPVPADAGETYEFSFDQYRVGGALSVTFYFDDADGNVITQPYEMVRSTTDTWERTAVRFEAPEGTVSARLLFYAVSGATLDTFIDRAHFAPAVGEPDEPDEESRVETILAQDDNLEYLGTPVTTQIPSQAAHGIEDGRHVSYQAFKGDSGSGYPATFAVTDVETGDLIRSCVVEGAEAARNLNIADDGRVYWGTYHDSKLWRYDPATGECEDMGRMSDQKDSTFGMSPGPDNSMYIGAYPDGRLLQVDAQTDEVELLREIDPNADYIHAIAYHEATDTVYVGSGGQVPQIWKVEDAGRGEQTLIADESTAPGLNDGTQFVGRMDIVGDRIFAQVGLRMLVLDLDGNVIHWDPEQTRYFFGHHLIQGADSETAIFSTSGGALVEYSIGANSFRQTDITIGGYLSNGVVDDSSGTPLLYGTSASGVFVADLASETMVSENAIDFAQPTLIQKLLEGPDGSVWASGYMVGLSQVDPSGADHGPTMQRGQFESAVVRDGNLYLGGYGHARFDVLDPATYDPADPNTVPTLFNGADEGQDRPFGMAYNPDRDEIYMGSVATYGQTQGGLAIWDGATGEHEWLTSEIGADENIVSVAYNPTDGLVYIGSTVDGGLGSDPSGNTAGKLIVFDPATRSVVARIDPAGAEREGITGLMVDPDGLVWGVAEESLFAYDPATGQSEVRGNVGGSYSTGTTYWAYGTVMRSNADGLIYVSAGGRFSVHDPSTGETTRIANGLRWGAVDGNGDVYLSAGAHLFRYNVAGSTAELACTATVTEPVSDGLVVSAGEMACVDGARVAGGVNVQPGGSLLVEGSTVLGGLTSSEAATVQLRDSSIRGAVSVTATTGAFVFAGNDLRGSLACSSNSSEPENEGAASVVSGSSSGQCAGI
ncbi:carbohydrate binding domain-containing protein [Ruania alkalisoli]|uniref:Carbohydrate binding domain-containing protein n=1 Tax=Ruania alkalisoli TaxID=2779775 RepID=A0A7M1SPX9_9MICO|nr:carbohydrate binding domain-containing protein [Ruania alkalisoli]QOR69618.1 carbohydrate binding domain-containing protein [Ruania alkalisoli]